MRLQAYRIAAWTTADVEAPLTPRRVDTFLPAGEPIVITVGIADK